MKNKKNIWLWVLVAALLLLAVGYSRLDKTLSQEAYNQEQIYLQELQSRPFSNLVLDPKEHIRGDLETAQIVVIEYSDTECPYCKSFHQKFKEQVFHAYSGNIAWVYRHFPLSIYPRSRKEAEALECAASQKGNEVFWNYLEEIFSVTPSRNGLDPATLPKIAAKLQLNVPTFEECLQESLFAETVENQKYEGVKMGVHETPSVIIWNRITDEKKLISGANSRFLEVKHLLELALSEIPQ